MLKNAKKEQINITQNTTRLPIHTNTNWIRRLHFGFSSDVKNIMIEHLHSNV